MSNRSLANTAFVSFVVFASCVICGPRWAAAVPGDSTESVVVHGPLGDLPAWSAAGTCEYGGLDQLAAAAESSRPQNPPPAGVSREWLSQAKGQIREAVRDHVAEPDES